MYSSIGVASSVPSQQPIDLTHPTTSPPASDQINPTTVPVNTAGAATQPLGQFRYSDLRYIGQALQCYLLCEWNAQLVVIDMHAAHERINFNSIRRQFKEQAVSSQQLLLPLSITLSPSACDALESQSHFLEQFGFEIDRFADDAVVLRAVPGMLIDSDMTEFIKHLVAQNIFLSVQGALDERIDAMAARVACHASIRSGYAIKREEAYALFARLDSSEFSAACPHGRPVVVTFSTSAIEKWFGRDR
jgi:DNA mismatch repair protein MutL